MSLEDLYSKLKLIENQLIAQNILKKEVLNLAEAATYLDISRSHLYKLTSMCIIPCYKPNGKRVYFNRLELDQWIQFYRIPTRLDAEEVADKYLLEKGFAII
jgi:excisionase family DNA binding protein